MKPLVWKAAARQPSKTAPDEHEFRWDWFIKAGGGEEWGVLSAATNQVPAVCV